MTELHEAIERINEELRIQDLSQANLARRTKISETSISRWLKGKRIPTIDNYLKMCKALGLKMLLFK